MKTVKISSMVIGLSIVFQWGFFILSGNVPELQSAPVSIAFHIIIELATAAALISAGIMLSDKSVKSKHWAVFAQGMLCYTVVNSAGYFAQAGDWGFVLMFAVLLYFALSNTLRILRN